MTPAGGMGVSGKARPRARLLLIAAIGLVTAAAGVFPLARPSPAAAGTVSGQASDLFDLINAERTRRGLVPLRQHSQLVDLAGERAAYMASTGSLAHISCLSCRLNERGIQYWYAGETIASNNYPYGDQAVQRVFDGWMASSRHSAVLMSASFNYIGVGVAYRSANGTTYASAIVTESLDRTSPWARMGGGTRVGHRITWTWSGGDTRLQTHTAGLKNFDVQYRVASGAWTTIRSGTTATSLTLDRGPGTYGIRVRSRDNRGYLCGWTAEVRVTVP